ncbi:MAG: hypothetical protein J6Y01_05480 [Spirochaetales bacterium]|nr:hypothetical protein [Spirochaetales bacterium]
MYDIECLEKQKIDIIAEHIARYHDTELSEAEKRRIAELNLQIKQFKERASDG